MSIEDDMPNVLDAAHKFKLAALKHMEFQGRHDMSAGEHALLEAMCFVLASVAYGLGEDIYR